MIKVYGSHSSTSTRNARKFLLEKNIPFEYRNIQTYPLTFNELKEILYFTENGVEDILTGESGKAKKEVEKQGIVLDDLSLREFYSIVKKYPKILKTPISIDPDKGKLVVGFEEDRYSIFLNRKNRIKEYSIILESVREYENKRLMNGELIFSGVHD